MKTEGTESKRVTEVLSSHERTLEHQLSHNAFVPVYANVCRLIRKVTLHIAQEGSNSVYLNVMKSECHIYFPRYKFLQMARTCH
jgi:hypothetical protein